MTALVVLLGALIGAGVVLTVAGYVLPPEPRTTTSQSDLLRRLRPWVTRHGLRLGLGLVAGLALAAFTGMTVMVVAVPVAFVGLPVLLGAPNNRDVELLQALDRWIRGLAATLPTGRSITDAIRLSQRQAPEMLAAPLTVLVARLDDRWSSTEALRAMADELDSPDADAVLAALSLAAERGGMGATATLNALADSIQDRLKAQREIETERAKPRIVVRQVTIVTLAVLLLAMIFGRGFFEPYSTPIGQVILLCLLTLYVGALAVLRKMTLPRRRERILRSQR